MTGSKSSFFTKLAVSVWAAGLFFVGLFVFPWRLVNWGTLTFGGERTITVTGSSQQETKNQIATFTAGVNSVKDKKEDAVNEVNQKMDEIVKAVKDFGVKQDDVKTQNASIYQMQETYYEDGRQKTRPGQWSVNNSVEIVLRQVDKAAALADLLSKSGANNVNGPMFAVDTKQTEVEAALLASAIDDATSKAKAVAAKMGAKLGVVLSVVEGISQAPIYPLFAGGRGGGGGAVVEPGTSTVSKTVTVTFKIND